MKKSTAMNVILIKKLNLDNFLFYYDCIWNHHHISRIKIKSQQIFSGYRLSRMKVMRLGNTIVDKFRSFNHENLHLLNVMNM